MADLQYVVFRLGGEQYGGDIMTVREIIKPAPITRVPNNPPFIEGIIKLRGEIVPVLDLKKRFELGQSDQAKADSRFVIAEVDGMPVAFIVDEVREVLRLEKNEIGAVPDMVKIGKEYVTGTVEKDGHLIILLDLAKILNVDERTVLAGMRL